MNIETIKSMINESTWTNTESKSVYRFSSGNHLSINGKDDLQYSLNVSENKVVLELGSKKKYFIEYVNDFILNLYNGEERFSIMPD